MLTDRQRLTEAKAAYHSLQTGTMARVVVDQNGERVEFNAANAGRLAAYIQQLEVAVGSCSGATPTNGPARFLF